MGPAQAVVLKRLALLDDILDVVLDTDLDDTEVGAAERAFGAKRLGAVLAERADGRRVSDEAIAHLDQPLRHPDVRHPRRPRAPRQTTRCP